jgi:2,5-diketo-D-gluconate reductase B
VAEKHDTSPAAVSIAWVLAHENVVTIPKASSREHLEANWAARDLELDAEDVERIDAIGTENELYPE